MPKKPVTTAVETIEVENQEMTVERSMKFVDSALIPGAVECVVIVPENPTGEYYNIRLFDAKSALRASLETLGGCISRGGVNVHVHNPEYSKHRGDSLLYVGGGVIRDSIVEGLSSIIMEVNGKKVTIALPKYDDLDTEEGFLFGEWSQVYMRTPSLGKAAPAKDHKHKLNLDVKHEYADLLLDGVRLVVFTQPSMVKGKVWTEANKLALEMKAGIVNEDGTLKTQKEIAEFYFAGLREYSGDRAVARTGVTVRKFAEAGVVEIKNTIMVDGVVVPCHDVAPGFYTSKQNGRIKELRFTVWANSDGVEAVIGQATLGCELTTIKKF